MTSGDQVVQVERYKNSPNHTHSLSEVDRLKWPKVIRSLVEIEAAKNYPPPAITSAVKEYVTLELDLGEYAHELKRKENRGILLKISRSLVEIEAAKNYPPPAITSAVKEYATLELDLGKCTRTVFVHPEQLKKLERHGWLTFIDSTHKTNRYDWRLFTLYVRDTFRCWNVGAHFFINNENANTVAEALTIIRNKYCHWSSRYILADHSNIEAKSIKKTFSGIDAGEQECQVLLCVVHVMRMWMQKINEKKT
ncbi:hypothetical protein RhiirB3_393511 [Rhizophagus irregularis]|nr:hypothetical protein RhiirB3_393511 [Rhizophagus irregularis]